MNLQELTGQESGIVIYSSGQTIVANWHKLGDNELPAVLTGLVLLQTSYGEFELGFDLGHVGSIGVLQQTSYGEFEQRFEPKHIDDVSAYVQDNMTTLEWDELGDIERLAKASEQTSGTIYYINADDIAVEVVAPEGWN